MVKKFAEMVKKFASPIPVKSEWLSKIGHLKHSPPKACFTTMPQTTSGSITEPQPRALAHAQSQARPSVARKAVNEWSVGEVQNWVCSLGPAFVKYTTMFAENGVTGRALLTLNKTDLEEMGVISLHTKILMEELNARVTYNTGREKQETEKQRAREEKNRV
jgi:hypothetical protein